MMEISDNSWYSMSDPAILKHLGEFLKHTRLKRNQTQGSVAMAAGISRSTLIHLEKGAGGSLMSFIQVLRILEQLSVLSYFEIKKPPISPLHLAKLELTKRKRAARKFTPDIHPTKSDW